MGCARAALQLAVGWVGALAAPLRFRVVVPVGLVAAAGAAVFTAGEGARVAAWQTPLAAAAAPHL